MISGKIIFFLCLVASQKIVWKIFYSIWSNVKWKKKKFRNPLQNANPPPQSTVNPPQITVKKSTNPPSQHVWARVLSRRSTASLGLVLGRRRSQRCDIVRRERDRRSPLWSPVTRLAKPQCEKVESDPIGEAPVQESWEWPDRRSSSARKSREGGGFVRERI